MKAYSLFETETGALAIKNNKTGKLLRYRYWGTGFAQDRLDKLNRAAEVKSGKDELPHGLVRILKGALNGWIGYYDDEEAGKCIVYLGTPFASPSVDLDPKDIVEATEAEYETWKKDNAKFVEIANAGGALGLGKLL